MYITNDPDIACIVEKSGVDRIFIDLEYLGKEERQKGMNTVKSNHCEEDISTVASKLKKAELMVRINPMNSDSLREIDSVIEKGAKRIMLPMFKSVEEVSGFLEIVDGRVATTLLLEHIEAVRNLDDILKLGGIEEIHIGLNDLHLSMGLDFMFELLTNGVVEDIVRYIGNKGIPFGIGGVGRIGSGLLPAEMILAEHYRLGSSAAILSRSFCNIENCNCIEEVEYIFEKGIKEIKKYEKQLLKKNKAFFYENSKRMKLIVDEIVKSKVNDKG